MPTLHVHPVENFEYYKDHCKENGKLNQAFAGQKRVDLISGKLYYNNMNERKETNMTTKLFTVVPFSYGLIQGTSLYKTLPGVTDEAVRNAFGEAFENQNDEKYSDSLICKSAETGILYTLYKSYGNWRIGAGRNASEADFELFIEALGNPSFA